MVSVIISSTTTYVSVCLRHYQVTRESCNNSEAVVFSLMLLFNFLSFLKSVPGSNPLETIFRLDHPLVCWWISLYFIKACRFNFEGVSDSIVWLSRC